MNVLYDILNEVSYNKHSLTYILTLIDIVILFGNNILDDSNIDEKSRLLFMHKDKQVSYIYDKLDTYVKDLIKLQLEVETDKKAINALKKKGKVRFISKIQDDFYIMNDLGRNWVFDNENIEYIKKHNKNPYNGEIIPKDIVDNI